jgi:tRNA G26 N,N-dimethylase Trm1
MKLIILRTNIKNKKKVKRIKPILNKHPQIISWSVDTEDIDKVLRIESTNQLFENEVIELIENNGFQCEDLPEYILV